METINIVSIFTIAFLGSFGHCIGMCGGIVVAYSSIKIDIKQNKGNVLFNHLLYNFGRVVTYTIMGIIFGYLGSVFSFGAKTNAAIYFIAGIFMIITGFFLLGIINDKILGSDYITNTKLYKKYFKKMINSKKTISFFGLGLLNGLLPCGLVYFFTVTAASTGDMLWGGIVMMIFGIATVPALMLLAIAVDFLKSRSIRTVFFRIAGTLVIIYGLYTIYRAYRFLVIPGLSLLNCH